MGVGTILWGLCSTQTFPLCLPGYERILTFRKEDGSYGAWLTRPSSTW